MIDIYHWEDDDEAEDLVELLNQKGIKYQATVLDAEMPSASPSVTHKGKTYCEIEEFLDLVKDPGFEL